jgi:hypothetical protein
VLADLVSPLAPNHFDYVAHPNFVSGWKGRVPDQKMSRLLRNAALIHLVRLGGKVSDRSHADGTNFTISSLQCF